MFVVIIYSGVHACSCITRIGVGELMGRRFVGRQNGTKPYDPHVLFGVLYFTAGGMKGWLVSLLLDLAVNCVCVHFAIEVPIYVHVHVCRCFM